MKPIAVVNEAHSVAIRIQAWMMASAGFEVYAAGASFKKVVPNYHYSGQRIPEISGIMELARMPQDAFFVDTHPGSIQGLRGAGWRGPILLTWYMPVGPDWVKQNLKPSGKVGSLAWSHSVGRGIREMNVCPNDCFWPPYYHNLDTRPREAIGNYLLTAVQNAAGWSNAPFLQMLRDDPLARLELYGGGPPAWSKNIPQEQFFARLRGCLAMYHLKPFDTPGFVVMEAALQGVPIIFPPDWLRSTENPFFINDQSCLVVPTEREPVLAAVRRLGDPAENRRIGLEGRKRILEETDWKKNLPRFQALLEAIRRA